MPGARRTRSLVCERKAHELVTTGTSHRPTFPARRFYDLLRALPGDRAFLPPSLPKGLPPGNLTPASGRQDHTASSSAKVSLVRRNPRVHRIPHPTFVTTAKRPSTGHGTHPIRQCFAREVKRIIFAAGAGQEIADLPVGRVRAALRHDALVLNRRRAFASPRPACEKRSYHPCDPGEGPFRKGGREVLATSFFAVFWTKVPRTTDEMYSGLPGGQRWPCVTGSIRSTCTCLTA
jgi:hypothetical protein